MKESEVLLKILTELDAGGIDQAKDKLKGMMDTAREAEQAGKGTSADMVASYDAIKNALAQASAGGEGFFKSILAGAKGIPPALAGTVAAAGGVVLAYKAASEALAAFAEKQDAVAQLDAVLAGQGQLTDAYREKLQRLAGAMQEATTIGDEQWTAVLARLTQFGADNTNIESYTDAVKNLAGIIGGDVQTAASMFSRALQGNFDLFGRYGIRVEEAGSQTERLNKLMEQLANRGAGVLEAKAKTVTGQFAAMRNATGDLSAAFGALVAKTGAAQDFTTSVKWAANALADLVGTGIIEKIEGLENKLANSLPASAREAANAFDQIKNSAEEAWKAASDGIDKQISKEKEYLKAKAELEKSKIAIDSSLSPEEKKRKIAEIDATVAAEEVDLEKRKEEEKFRAVEETRRQLSSQVNLAENAAIDAEKSVPQDYQDRRRKYLLEKQKLVELEQTKAQNRMDYVKATPGGVVYDPVFAANERKKRKALDEQIEAQSKVTQSLSEGQSALPSAINARKLADAKRRELEEWEANVYEPAKKGLESKTGLLDMAGQTVSNKATATRTELDSAEAEAKKARAEEAAKKARDAQAAADAKLTPGQKLQSVMGTPSSAIYGGQRVVEPSLVQGIAAQDREEIAEGISQGLKADEIARAVQATGTVLQMSFADLVRVVEDLQRRVEVLKSRNNNTRG